MTRTAHVGASVFDGTRLHDLSAALFDGSVFDGVVAQADVPEGYALTQHAGGTILPGFVDLQVNGGGGVLFNDDPSVGALVRIAQAHAREGTTSILPTLITDRPDVTDAAIAAAVQAVSEGVPGILGLHLEGPHLSVAQKGAHDPALIRSMRPEDEAMLLEAAARLPVLKVTLAAETVPPEQIARLMEGGVLVSLGHSDCSYEVAQAAIAAGARCVTHLFNAMSGLHHREPGLVGAALGSGAVSVGLIADGLHVHPQAIRVALAAKEGSGGVYLVSDAMALTATGATSFTLNGRRVMRRDGALRLEDGTLAGADLTMAQAVRFLIRNGLATPEAAFAMATSVPAGVVGQPPGVGRLENGQVSPALHMAEDGAVRRIA